MLCQGKTGQGQTAFKLKEDISSTQKLSGPHFLNNRDSRALRRMSHAPLKQDKSAGIQNWEQSFATLSTLLYGVPGNCICFYQYTTM